MDSLISRFKKVCSFAKFPSFGIGVALILFVAPNAFAIKSFSEYQQDLSENKHFEVFAEVENNYAYYSNQDEGFTQALANALILLADVYFEANEPEKAFDALISQQAKFEQFDIADIRAQLHYRLGKAAYQVSNSALAKLQLELALKYAKTAGDFKIQAAAGNDLGLALIAREELDKAETVFELAYLSAKRARHKDLMNTVGLNFAKVTLDNGNYTEVPKLLNQIAKLNNTTNEKHWLKLGRLYLSASKYFVADEMLRLKSYQSFEKALQYAKKSKNHVILSYAYGYIGNLYELEGRYSEALGFTAKAQFKAQEAAAADSLYLWEWQNARLYRALGHAEKSQLAYAQAIETLKGIGSRLNTSKAVDFKKDISPLYFQYSDMLISRLQSETDAEKKQALLKNVIGTLELLKVAEVEDYFESDCVVLPENQVDVATVGSGVAVLYPVILEDRTELILQIDGSYSQYTASVSQDLLRKTVTLFREKIESYSSTHDYKSSAQQLYNWLIKPIDAQLVASGIETLVFVPDGILRTIPLSALYDGNQFLIEKFAMATTPGMTLTSPKSFDRSETRILANGLTDARQGFSALPSVGSELDQISKVFPTSVFKNGNYLLNTVSGELSQGDYSVVHFATHGVFDRDHSKSFLLTYDGKLTMDQIDSDIGLRRYTDDPLELLVLSACQTAVGDDKAALGLAGVAIKAGARSALATLWFINDEATSTLVSEFYRQLNVERQSKAEALRSAQLHLINDINYDHPSLWAPFLMIGNWM